MNNLIPHGYCLASDPWLVIGLVIADLIIAAVYFMIPLALISIQKRVGFVVPIKTRIGAAFAAFIFLCGASHVARALTMFWGGYMYAVELTICAATATASVLALIMLFQSRYAIAIHLRAIGHALIDAD